MADIPEHKTKRLMSLNQDVFAVKPDSAPAEPSEPERRKPARQTAQKGPVPQPQPARPVSAPVARGAEQRPGSRPLLLALLGVVAVLVLVVAAGAVAGFHLYERIGALQAQLEQPDDLMPALESRIAALEKSLDAAGKEADQMDGEAQSSMLQLTGRLRKVALDLSRVTAELERQKKRVIEASASAGRAEELAAEQAGRLDTLSARVSALPTQTASAPAAPAATSDEQARAQVQALQGRVDKMANEIRSIYRLLEQTR